MNIEVQRSPRALQVPEEQRKQADLERMKRLATALLGLVTLVFIVSKVLEERYAWLGFVRAFAEAAMVGAIADWFAVTALFRHPLGLPIPHTAIIPSRKNSLGRSLGRFVKNNFLAGDVISAKLRSIGIARRVAAWLSRPEHSREVAGHVANALAGMVQVVKDEDIQELIERGIIARIRLIQVAPLVGRLLGLVTAGHRQEDLVNGGVELVGHLLEENKAALRERISRETPWWLPWPIDEQIYSKIVGTIEMTLREVSTDAAHPMRAKVSSIIDRFIEDLKHSPETIAKGEALKEELLQHPIVREFSASLWGDLKTSLLEASDRPYAAFQEPIQRGIARFGESLQNDEALIAKIDQWVEQAALYFIEEYGHEVEQLITQTVSGWDAEATSQKLELQVGRDLQFIRINGTLVGGLVGLVIYTVSLFL